MINWNPSPTAIAFGSIEIRWYGLLFAAAFYTCYFVMRKAYKLEQKPLKNLDGLLNWMVLGTLGGARLGHCLFYNPGYYLSNPLEILKIWQGGLASHGAVIGIVICCYFYARKHPSQPFLWLCDRIAMACSLGAALVRTGNLMNSEIIGTPTKGSWAFVFERIDNIPRHPAQLYEAIFCLITFSIIYSFYRSKKQKVAHGQLLGLFLILIFSFRFVVEFIKERQTDFEVGLPLHMGQLLSIPAVTLGLYLFFRKKN